MVSEIDFFRSLSRIHSFNHVLTNTNMGDTSMELIDTQLVALLEELETKFDKKHKETQEDM